MSNNVYPNTQPFAHERNVNVNFNYIWDGNNWVPQGAVKLSLEYIRANAKSVIHKFGSNPNVSNSVSKTSQETIWDGSSAYTFPPNDATGIQVKSDDSNDNQQIIIEGLDSNFYVQKWTGNLNGTSNVNIDGTWSRVYRAYNNDSTNISGIINIHASGNDALSYAKIIDGNNQTLMSLYTIPVDCTGYLVGYNLSAQNTSSSSEIGFTVYFQTREYNKVFRVQEVNSVNTSSPLSKDFPFPLKFEPKTDVIFNVVSANGNNGSINADFDIALL